MALHTAAIAMGNQTADRPFFVSAIAVSGSCFSFISQCNCLISELLQEHSKGSFDYGCVGPRDKGSIPMVHVIC